MLFQIITSKCRHAIFALFIVVNYVKSIRYRGQVFTSNIIQNDHIFIKCTVLCIVISYPITFESIMRGEACKIFRQQ